MLWLFSSTFHSTLLFTFPKVYHPLAENPISNVRCLGDLRDIFPFQEYLAIQNTELKGGDEGVWILVSALTTCLSLSKILLSQFSYKTAGAKGISSVCRVFVLHTWGPEFNPKSLLCNCFLLVGHDHCLLESKQLRLVKGDFHRIGPVIIHFWI